MFNNLKVIAIALATSSAVSLAHADSTLVYELTGTDGSKTQQTISISGRWLRLESKPKGKYDYTVMDTGRMLMFEVDDKAKTFQVTRMGRLYWPVTPLNNPNFMPISKKQAVSGVRCQLVHEMAKDKKSMTEHCMTAGGPLGMNSREMITLSRFFMSARRVGLSWPGVATIDERQTSILSKNPDGRRQEFKSVKHHFVVKNLLKIPVDYQRLQPDLPPLKNKKKNTETKVKPKSELKSESGKSPTS